jgi:hypothetical protein
MSDIQVPGPNFSGSGPVEYIPVEPAPEGGAEAVLARERTRLLAIPGVMSVGIGFGPPGVQALVVGVMDAGVSAVLPQDIDGVPVVVTVTGSIDAFGST